MSGFQGRRSEYADIQWKLRRFFALRHQQPEYPQRARQCIRILRAHKNYLILHQRAQEVS